MTAGAALARLLAGVLAVAALIAVAGLLVARALDGSAVEELEVDAAAAIVGQRTSFWTALTGVVSGLADTATVVVLAALALALLWAIARRRAGLYVVAAVAGETLAFLLVTLVVDRPRPSLGQLDVAPPTSSFPSGHTAAAVALYGSLAVVVRRVARSAWLRRIAGALAVLLALGVALARLYRGMHWPSDVLAGALLGILWLTVATRVVLPARSTTPPRAPPPEPRGAG